MKYDIYPIKIAPRAVDGIKDFYDLNMSLDGTVEGLIEDGNTVGAVHYLVHSVATTPKQVKSINEFISGEVKSHPDIFTGFGSLHPDSEDIEGDLDYLIELGLKGVKVHPDFQQFALNAERAFRMGAAISDRGLPMMIHCGDFRYNYSNPEQLKPFLEEFPDITVIGAHLSLYSLSPETARDLLRGYGVEKVLWATDFPMWTSKSEMEMFNRIDLTDEERNKILYENAAKLLGLE